MNTPSRRLLCIGLDSDIERLPKHLLDHDDPQFAFNQAIIDATHDLVGAYKPNIAFYEALGRKGLESLEKTIAYIPKEIPVILDVKRGDIGNTSRMYAKAYFEEMGVDAVTVHAYMGEDAVAPFLAYEGKITYIMVKNSNPSAGEIQDLELKDGRKVYEMMAEKVNQWNAKYSGTAGAVVGATYPEDIKRARELMPEIPFLIPGLGAQGGDAELTVKYGLNANGGGILINSARGIIFASGGKDFAEAAHEAAKKVWIEIQH